MRIDNTRNRYEGLHFMINKLHTYSQYKMIWNEITNGIWYFQADGNLRLTLKNDICMNHLPLSPSSYVPLCFFSLSLSEYIHAYTYIYWPNEKGVRKWSGRPGFSPRSTHTKDSKKVLVAPLLNTQHYKVRIKGKVEQSRERSSAPTTPQCGSYWKGSLQVNVNTGHQLYSYIYINSWMYVRGAYDKFPDFFRMGI